jgi:DNA-binding ferritin-like protein
MLRVCLPSSAARLSQDSNILSRNVTDGVGRLRYIPHARVEQGLACLGALALHVAERIVVLGGVAMGTARKAALQSGLPEYPGAIVAGHAQVVALAERLASYSAATWGGIALAADVEDADSAAVCGDISRGIDKRLWVLDAHRNR